MKKFKLTIYLMGILIATISFGYSDVVSFSWEKPLASGAHYYCISEAGITFGQGTTTTFIYKRDWNPQVYGEIVRMAETWMTGNGAYVIVILYDNSQTYSDGYANSYRIIRVGIARTACQ